ncbi:hypothetical protein [Rhodoplanes azumiensis]|uniref:Uncharacterized protein n=1 Tax=Rhodoplanes azumiensis TaxID=1897628 RepID=A0ABW5ALT0_9BRAD
MTMRPVEIFFAVLGVVVLSGAGYFITRPVDPVVNARYKCETALERFVGFDIAKAEADKADIKGNAHTGRVEMSFTHKAEHHLGTCVFRNGEMTMLDLDGKLLAGRRE